MSKKHVVVSLGHDALGYTTLEQRDAVRKTALEIGRAHV